MDIKQFIKTTLDEIVEGIKTDSSCSGKKHFYLDSSGVDFDLAVLVSEQKQKEIKGLAKAEIKVVNLGGDYVNTKTEKSEYVSRVKFTVRYGNDDKGRVINPRNGTSNNIY